MIWNLWQTTDVYRENDQDLATDAWWSYLDWAVNSRYLYQKDPNISKIHTSIVELVVEKVTKLEV